MLEIGTKNLENELENAYCQKCRNEKSKYKCPGCGMRTCSLPCSKAHRESTGCTGKRSRTGLVKVADFTEKQLLADIRLMEEIERECGAAKRREPQRLPAKMPPFLQELQREAGKRRVNLRFLGPGMEKRLQNSTYHDRRQKRLLWHIEWVFVAAKLHLHDRRVPERSNLRQLLEKHVQPQRRGFKDDEKMQPYTDAGTAGLTVLMRQTHAPVNRARHYKLDLNGSLASQLEEKSIMEFPVFLVLLHEEADKYPLVGGEQQIEERGRSSEECSSEDSSESEEGEDA